MISGGKQHSFFHALCWLFELYKKEISYLNYVEK